MNFETYGKKDNKAIILIHGAFVSWKMWSEYIETFKQEKCFGSNRNIFGRV